MGLYNKLFSVFEKDYLLYAMIGVLISSCLGAGASMLALNYGEGTFAIIQVIFLVAAAMIYNASILANMPAKTVFNWGLASVFVSTVVLLIYLM